MKLFSRPTEELTNQIASLEAQVTELSEQAARVADLEADLAQTRAGFDAERAELQASLDAANAIIEDMRLENVRLTDEAKFTAEKVSLEAQRLLATQGVPPAESLANADEAPDEFAGKSLDELSNIALGMRNSPKAQREFVNKYIRPKVGQ